MARDLTQGSIGRWLYRLTAPMVVGILSIFLFNLVDTYFISLLGTQPLAAVSFTFPINMLVMNVAIGLSIATGAVVARALGQKNHLQAQSWVTSSLYLTICIGIGIAILGILFHPFIFKLMGATDELIPIISEYMVWWFSGSTLLMVMIVVNASIRASGNTKLPSLAMMASAGINVILDPILIFGLGPIPALGVQGAAIASVLSWLAAFVFMFRYLQQNRLVEYRLPEGLMRLWQKLFTLAVPAAITNMLGPIANSVLIAWVAGFGTAAVAAFGVGMRIEPLAMIVVMAFTSSLPPFVGQNHGAGEVDRIGLALRKSLTFILFWQTAVYLLLILLAEPLSRQFSEEKAVQEIIQTFLFIVPLSYIGVGFTLLTTATINALHKPKISMKIHILRLFVFYLPFAWVGQAFYGLEGLFIGCALGNVAIGISVLVMIRHVKKSDQWQQRLLTIQS
ncbi:MATE family efflux transporter [Bermanella marisrubri]|uniref:Putative multi antimicrobial extrusion protein MatE/Na+-driven multidrug efflux pump n=1 Tax=Bermanella marisrubri TaxID=207949 RepID=Q1MXR2_9GAMM|nr:MATE family efflux transporter [Bermanella marisrubri]EAT10755.1 putative multi antimicrobial extrusion protein MatE/Na+-driven multidrug efflux pump [Oceanobacter sp. RED65] [Bermanella marisrubri]QIZ83083.1 MATE family efflux transporter [Bermanella marisrubri]